MLSEKDEKIMNFPLCLKGQFHIGEKIDSICFENSCNDKRIGCKVCMKDYHKNHRTNLIYNYLEKVNLNLDFLEMEELTESTILNLLEKFSKEMPILNDFNYFCTRLLQKVEEINQIFINWSKKMENLLLNGAKSEISKLFITIYSENMTEKKLSKSLNDLKYFFKDLKNSQIINFSKNINILSETNNFKKKVEEETSKINEKFFHHIKINNQIAEQKNKSPIIFIPTKESSRTIFKFHRDLHGPEIEIIDDYRAKAINKNFDRHSILFPNVPEYKNSKFCFRIFSKKDWLGLGFCINTKLLDYCDFSKNYRNIGHGYYIISSDKQVWSNFKNEVNNQTLGFEFGTGDSVVCQYDPFEKIIVFAKRNTGFSFKMQVQTKEREFLYPCVLFNGINSIVEIQNF